MRGGGGGGGGGKARRRHRRRRRGMGDLAHLVLRDGLPLFYFYFYTVAVVSKLPASSSILPSVYVCVSMGASAAPSKSTRLLPRVTLEPTIAIAIAIAIEIVIVIVIVSGAELAGLAGEAGPLAEGRDKQEGGEDDVVEEDGRDGPRPVAVVVRRDGRAVDAQVEVRA